MTVPQRVPVSAMFAYSMEVLGKPSVATFERYERHGTAREAFSYVAIAAAVSALIGLVGGLGGAIVAFLTTMLGFLVFTYAVYFAGKTFFGGTGTYDEVAFTFSLFYVPLSVIGALLGLIPLLGLLTGLIILVAQIYYGYLAVQSSMNIRDSGPAIITLVIAGAVNFVLAMIIGGIFAAILIGGAMMSGAGR
ncbi:hypothetical protein HNR42_002348 [Deinobacterium chartae]|uniref:Yip1 domain-containing protein n=1 Tax=Deinobacterium chartae TaxID=521158 RepID=A0A841I111_9DEIO|nr:YIP1 family protein [Deinobacterium chartae]MBB6098913.1 hypothetical protein [Deinobacterium chartae]